MVLQRNRAEDIQNHNKKKEKIKKKKTLLDVFNTSGSYLHKNEIINIRIFPVHETGPVR